MPPLSEASDHSNQLLISLRAMVTHCLCFESPWDSAHHLSHYNAVLMFQSHFSACCLSHSAAEGHSLNITIYLLISLSPYVSEHRGNPSRNTEAILWQISKANSSFSSLHSTKRWLRASAQGCISWGSWEGRIICSHSPQQPFQSMELGRK